MGVNGEDLLFKGGIFEAFVALFSEPVADEGEGCKDVVNLPGV